MYARGLGDGTKKAVLIGQQRNHSEIESETFQCDSPSATAHIIGENGWWERVGLPAQSAIWTKLDLCPLTALANIFRVPRCPFRTHALPSFSCHPWSGRTAACRVPRHCIAVPLAQHLSIPCQAVFPPAVVCHHACSACLPGQPAKALSICHRW